MLKADTTPYSASLQVFKKPKRRAAPTRHLAVNLEKLDLHKGMFPNSMVPVRSKVTPDIQQLIIGLPILLWAPERAANEHKVDQLKGSTMVLLHRLHSSVQVKNWYHVNANRMSCEKMGKMRRGVLRKGKSRKEDV